MLDNAHTYTIMTPPTRKDRMNGLNPKIFIPAVVVYTLIFYAIALSICRAESIPEDRAIRAIIGEAAGEVNSIRSKYECFVAVGAALRNRGSLRGVFGEKAKHVDREPRWVWDLARRAWRESAKRDPTNGATHWENIEKFGIPYWSRSMIKTVKIGSHTFYKKKGGRLQCLKRMSSMALSVRSAEANKS